MITSLGAKVHKITILHTNDLHAHISAEQGKAGAAAIAGYFKQVKKEEKNVLVLDAGDLLQGPPVSAVTKGKAVFEVVDLMGYSVLTLGNHEFDYGAEALSAAVNDLETPIVSCNVLYRGRPFLPSAVLVRLGELRVAVVGGLGGSLHRSIGDQHVRDFKFTRLSAALKKQVEEWRGRADLVVAITHQGFDKDLRLAEKMTGLDVIIGGHDHGWHNAAKMVGIIRDAGEGEEDRWQTVVASAAPYGKAVGHLVFSYDDQKDQVMDFEFRLVTAAELAQAEPGGAVKRKVAKIERSLTKRFGRKLAEAAERLDREGWEKSVGGFVADGLAWAVDADIGLTNAGGLRDDLAAGEVTVADIWKVSPFDNTICTFYVTGEEVVEILEGYTSRRSGALQVSGLSYSFRFAGRKTIVTKCSLDERRRYRVSTTDYVCQQIEKRLKRSISYDNSGMDWRKALEEYAAHLGVISRPESGRIVYEGGK